MLVMSSSGSFGRTQFGQPTAQLAEDVPVYPLTSSLTTLAQAETQLRTTFAKLLPDILALQAADKAVTGALLDLLRRYNAAVGSLMEASKIWLQVRAQTPANELPDPNSQAIAVPTYDLPTSSGFGLFGDVAARDIKIRAGIVGRETIVTLSSYMNSSFASYGMNSHLGAPLTALGWAVVLLLGLAITGAVIYGVARALQTSDTAAANQTISDQAHERTREVISDRELFTSTRDSCMGNSTDQAVRVMCIEAAKDVLKTAKEGRQEIQRPVSPVVISAVAVLSVLAIAGGVGYVIYRKQRNVSPLPSARARNARSARSSYDMDADEDVDGEY